MHDYVFIGPGEQLSPDVLQDSKILAFDVESTGTSVYLDSPVGLSITNSPEYAFYADINDTRFTSLLANESILKVAHNAKFDRSMLKKVGIIVNNLCDTMIAAHLLEYGELSLKFLVGHLLHKEVVSFEELRHPIIEIPVYERALYSCPHSQATFALWQYLEPRLKRLGLLRPFWDIEMPLVPVLSDIELNGVLIDKDKLSYLDRYFTELICVLERDLNLISGKHSMNHNSPDQVSSLLYDEFMLPAGRYTSSEKPSVDKRYLEKIKDQHPYISVYLAFKELSTLKNSYTTSLSRAIQPDGRIHGNFNQTRTRTGRLSSSDPNLQKIPQRTQLGKTIRTTFVAPPEHKLVKADYDLLELKEMAIQSHDPDMLAAFRDGRDIHVETAIKLYGSASQRFRGKTANFQIIYQGGDSKTRKALEEVYPQVFKWTRAMNLQARMDLYVRTRGGRIRTIDELFHENPVWMIEHGEREAMSTRIQGSSAEEVKKGMTRARKALEGSHAKMNLQVHDEVLFEVPDSDVNDVVQCIYRVMPTYELTIPLTVTVEVGQNWGNMREVKEGEKW